MKFILKGFAVLLAMSLMMPTGYAEEEGETLVPSEETIVLEEITEDPSSSDTTETPSSSEELTGEKEGNTVPDDSQNSDESSSDDSVNSDNDSSADNIESENGSSSEENGDGESDSSSGEGSAEDNDEREDSSSEETDNSNESDSEKEENSEKPSSSKKSSGISYANVRTKATLEGVSVTVEELGTIYTQIKANDELMTVLTQELDFTDVDENQLQLGYIVAPKTGRAAMRDKPAKGETIIRYCSAGDLAIILEVKEEYTHIIYKGTEGYVLNDTIQFVDIPEENGQYAQLSNDGRTDGGSIINIRNQPDRGSCKIVEWRTGTEVTVWNTLEGWYEIEAHGMRGFVMEEFVTIDPGV